MQWRYVDENRIGDHICYYSDLRKMQAHYPGWDITKTLTPDLRRDCRELDRASACNRRRHEDSDHRHLRICRQRPRRMPCSSAIEDSPSTASTT